MGIFRKLEEVFTGKIIRDYGVIDQKGRFATRKYSIYLTEKGGEKKIIIKVSVRWLLFGSVTYFEFDRPAALTLREILEDALTNF